jgi:hypothetical protein
MALLLLAGCWHCREDAHDALSSREHLVPLQITSQQLEQLIA